MAETNTNPENPPEIKLKDPALAAFLAWLVPGLGHWYQGRRAKAVLFFVCIMGIFGYGHLSREQFGDDPGDQDQNRLRPGGLFRLESGRMAIAVLLPDRRRPAHAAGGDSGPAGERAATRRWGGFMAPPRMEQSAENPAAPPESPSSRP